MAHRPVCIRLLASMASLCVLRRRMVIESDEGWKALVGKAVAMAVESQEEGATSSERQTTLGRVL